MYNGVRRSIAGVMDMFSPMNKIRNEQFEVGMEEGAWGEHLDELTLEMDDTQLIELSKEWEDKYEEYKGQIEPKQKLAEAFWLSQQKETYYGADDAKDNLIFESLETFLPMVTSTNPEPLVYADNTEQGNALSAKVKEVLSWQMDELVLRQKVRKMVRHWSLYYIGVMQVGWSTKRNDIDAFVVLPKMLILDPDATINENGVYEGEYLGKKVQTTASQLAKMFPNHKDYISAQVENKMGTKVTYTEWWTNEYLFFKFKNQILMKLRNPHFNYDMVEQRPNPLTGEMEEVYAQGNNHFMFPQMPFVFLSVYNLGTQPHDVTSLIEQNIPLQRRINKRNAQIDQNIDGMNNGIAVSGDSFNKEQATEAANALRKGNPLFVPKGDINTAFKELKAPQLSGDVYQTLIDYRNELRNVFGISGSTPQGIEEERTVRGKIMARQFDSSRNSFPIEAIEQVYDRLFNWMVQLFHVYYDEPHFASIIGNNKAVEMVMLQSADLNRKLQVSVREGSLLPKDPLTQRNEAIDLFQMGALDPKSLFEKLDFADPVSSARALMMYRMDPMAYMQLELGQQPMMPQMPGMGQPTSTDQGSSGGEGQDVTMESSSPSLSNVPLQQI